MASKEKSCIVCEISKPSSEFRRGQFVCKLCEEDPNVTYEKECVDCKKVKSKSLFDRNRVVCKVCDKIRKNPPKEKICITCSLIKTSKEFRRSQAICKTCEDDPDTMYKKKCRDCEEMKPISSFRKNRKQCLDCERSFGREYRGGTTKAKEWAEKNKERMTELQSKWYEENKERIRQKECDRLKTDKEFRTVKSYRVSVNSMLAGGTKRNINLATNRDRYIRWLEFCFQDGMTMENHHEVWHIDHVLPLDLLYKTCKSDCVDLIRENPNSQKLLFSWYNTFPLEKSENRLKSNSITARCLSKHILVLRRFLKANKDIPKDELYASYIKLIRQIIEAI